MVLEWVSLPLVLFAAFPIVLGSFVSGQCLEAVLNWYPTLQKPSWCPPAPLFGQIWSFLYVLMGLAAFVVWTEVGFGWPLVAWFINLVFNLAWMLIFYKKKDMKLAQIDNLVVLATGIYITKLFYKIKPVAGALLYPYVAFLFFANALNLAFIQLNGDAITESGIYENLHEKKNPGEAGYGPDGSTTLQGTIRPGAVAPARGPQGVPTARPLLRHAQTPSRGRAFVPRPAARMAAAPVSATTLKAML